MAETLAEYVASQDELLQEAALALPHEFSKCTYSLGHIRERPESRKPSPVPLPEHAENSGEGNDDDARSEGSSGLPPGLISGTEYEAFICGTCASRNKTLVRWAGTPGITMVVRDAPIEPWRRLVEEERTTEIDPYIDDLSIATEMAIGSKRPLSPSNSGVPDAKRLRGALQDPVPSSATQPCLAPRLNSNAHKIFEQLDAPAITSLGKGDLFLSENFRDRDNLVKYLRPFAQEGKVVSETDVREFFASLTEAAKKSGPK
ncbi:hypothetical protein H0H87_010861 [Tephrocybe sp. NHM501043]|nr:hypothetical protein H0H87_010861 [Tephrocybe sp. NHM501043]